MQSFYSHCRRFFIIFLLLGLFRLPILAPAEEVSQEDPPVPIAPTVENLNRKDYESLEVKTLKTLRKTTVFLRYLNVPLHHVLMQLHKQSSIPIHPLWDILEQEFDIHRELPITLYQPNKVSLDAAYQLLLEHLSAQAQKSITMALVEDEIYIGPEEDLPENNFSLQYYVGDLVGWSQQGGQEAHEEKFAELIQELDAELKTHQGTHESESQGDVEAIQALPPIRLVITQTYPNHCRIAKWFQNKRISLGKQVALEIRMVEIVGSAVKENLPDIYQHLTQPKKKINPIDFFPLTPGESKDITLSGYGLAENQLELLSKNTQSDPAGRFLDAPHVTIFDGEQVYLGFNFSRSKQESVVNDIKIDLQPTISYNKKYVLLDISCQMTCPSPKIRSFQAQYLIPDEQHIILAFFKNPIPLEIAPSLLQQSRMNRLNDVFAQTDTDLDKLFTILICKPRIILPQPDVQLP